MDAGKPLFTADVANVFRDSRPTSRTPALPQVPGSALLILQSCPGCVWSAAWSGLATPCAAWDANMTCSVSAIWNRLLPIGPCAVLHSHIATSDMVADLPVGTLAAFHKGFRLLLEHLRGVSESDDLVFLPQEEADPNEGLSTVLLKFSPALCARHATRPDPAHEKARISLGLVSISISQWQDRHGTSTSRFKQPGGLIYTWVSCPQ